jgi:putative PIN family toxin of toxin-antitoxin system
MSSQEIRDLADCLMFMADIVEPLESRDPQLRDEKDQPVLQTFLASTIDFLITGDKDLLALGDQYRIITPAEFWSSHGG